MFSKGSCFLLLVAILTLSWHGAQADPDDCALRLQLTTEQVKALENELVKTKADVKKATGTVPAKCPSNINSYQDGDDYLTRLTPEQVQQISATNRVGSQRLGHIKNNCQMMAHEIRIITINTHMLAFI